jgi:hypothetical protein
MNESDQMNVPPPIAPRPMPGLSPQLPEPRPLSWWVRKFLACNPFYLVSAALLLYGCYRVSVDPALLERESLRLVFNFTAMQAYEIILVLVAIFLAQRRLWYDSTLLVGLENLLVLVPFILISQAALTGPGMTEVICGAAVTVVALRFGALKRYYSQLNLPGRLLGMGAVLLAVNVALPLLYRHYINFKIGAHLDSGPDYEMNERNWLLVLPAVFALANLLPRAQVSGDLLPQHRWLPAGMFSLWVAVTATHLYSMDYVYGYYLRPELFAPAAWVLAWTLFLRCPNTYPRLKPALMAPAVLMPLLALSPSVTYTYLILAALNAAVYGVIMVMHRGNRLTPHLLYASVLTLATGLPDAGQQFLHLQFTAAQCAGLGLAGYLIFWTAWLRNPKLAVFGAIISGCLIMSVFGHDRGAGAWALQGGFSFLLLHSLRWKEAECPEGGAVRKLVALAWIIQSFIWMNSDTGRFWMPLIPGALVFATYCAYMPCRGIWRVFVVPVAALLVMVSGPCCMVVDGVRATPPGLLAVAASFIFLGFGTVAALTRHLWHKHENE